MGSKTFSAKERVSLPLATGETEFISLEYRDSSCGYHCSHILLWKDFQATEPKFTVPLRGSVIVNNITEIGPCLYLVASTGSFEFQCLTKEACQKWINTFMAFGSKFLKFTDLYRLTEFIGEGSFAKVYIGRHTLTNEEVVIKTVDKKKVLESNIYTEIEVLRKVSHPYINKLYAAYEQEDFVCLVLEYLRGGELFDYLSNKGPLSEDQARSVMRRLLLALQCLHVKGIVHRDLKTENLILENSNDPTSIKLIDFGLSTTIESPAMKMRCGSPGYVAPEILQDQAYGTKVDIFSSGVILYTLLVGFHPFRGQTVKDILKRNLRCHLDFTHDRWSGVAHSAKDLIGWMCSKNPAKRCAAPQALTHPWFHRVARPITSSHTQHQSVASMDKHPQQHGCKEASGVRAAGGPDQISLDNDTSSAEGLSNRLKVLKFSFEVDSADVDDAVGKQIEVTGRNANDSLKDACSQGTPKPLCDLPSPKTIESDETDCCGPPMKARSSSGLHSNEGNPPDVWKQGLALREQHNEWTAPSSPTEEVSVPPVPRAGPPTSLTPLLPPQGSQVRRDVIDGAEPGEATATTPVRGGRPDACIGAQQLRRPCEDPPNETIIADGKSMTNPVDSFSNPGCCAPKGAPSPPKTEACDASSEESKSSAHAAPPDSLAAMCLTAPVKDSRRTKRRAIRCLEIGPFPGCEGGYRILSGDGGASPADESLPPAALLGASGCVEEVERTLGAVQVSAQPSLASNFQEEASSPTRSHARAGVLSPVVSRVPPDSEHRWASSSSRERTQLARRLHSQVYYENCKVAAGPVKPDTQHTLTAKPPRLLQSVCLAAESRNSRRGICLSKTTPFRSPQCSEFTEHSSRLESSAKGVSPQSLRIHSLEQGDCSQQGGPAVDSNLANNTIAVSNGKREQRHLVATEKTTLKATNLDQGSPGGITVNGLRQGESTCENNGGISIHVLNKDTHAPCSTGRRGRSENLSRGSTPLQTLQNRLSEIISLPGLCRVATALGARDWLKAKGRGAPGPAGPSDDGNAVAEDTKRPSQAKRQFNRPCHHSERTVEKRHQNHQLEGKREERILGTEVSSVSGVSKHVQEV